MKPSTELIVLGVVCLGLIGLGVACVFTGNKDQVQPIVQAVTALLAYAVGLGRSKLGKGKGNGAAADIGAGAAVLALAAAAGFGAELLG
jgi:hypothetical protein